METFWRLIPLKHLLDSILSPDGPNAPLWPGCLIKTNCYSLIVHINIFVISYFHLCHGKAHGHTTFRSLRCTVQLSFQFIRNHLWRCQRQQLTNQKAEQQGHYNYPSYRLTNRSNLYKINFKCLFVHKKCFVKTAAVAIC